MLVLEASVLVLQEPFVLVLLEASVLVLLGASHHHHAPWCPVPLLLCILAHKGVGYGCMGVDDESCHARAARERPSSTLCHEQGAGGLGRGRYGVGALSRRGPYSSSPPAAPCG